MKRIATILCLTQLLTLSSVLGSERRLVAWKVANVGRHIITNGDVEDFIEQTQITDSIKTLLFKKAEKNFSKYQQLKREITQKNFKKATGQLIYAHIMQQDHRKNHGSKRVAFRTTETTYFEAVQKNETTILRSLLDQRMGIVKARDEFGKFLIKQDYPHQENETSTEVYWRWYEDQKARIKTELFLKEVKNYEGYIALRNQKYYHINYMELQDKYDSLKEEVESSLNNKKISHKSLLSMINSNDDWKIVIKELSNTQIETTPLKNYKDDLEVQNRADEILSTITEKNWDKITSYHSKISELIEKKYSVAQLDEFARKNTEIYIQDKSKYSNYMTALIAKLAARTREGSSIEEVSSLASDLNSNLREHLIGFKKSIINSESENALEKAVESKLLEEINYQGLSDLEKALAELSIFSIKFQIKKHSFESTMPVRISYNKYTDFKTNDALRNLLKYNWMKDQFKSYVEKEMIWSTEYMTIRTGENEYLTPEDKRSLIFGSDFQ
ncbi:hypothetical protein [Halobacteriovorax sp. JY17]|uniref:hypothetical protein n=1 Tax=Halobacteriovorax sp. JY17 TaxID=2014617 RepID=UPI000C53890A|nr:hypothetical protein [Halobacteriovorax sp. JY17]PIK15632.1 MAG: hypothetical protein CES88_02590 [Halobacteriovorax sp. JY17]